MEDEGPTDHTDLDLQSKESHDMIHTHAKGQRSLASKVSVEMNAQTDRGDCITSHSNRSAISQ